LHIKLCGTLAKTTLLCDNGALHVEDSIVIGGGEKNKLVTAIKGT